MPAPRAVSVVSQDDSGARFAMSDGSVQYLTGPSAQGLAARLPAAAGGQSSGGPQQSLPQAGSTGSWEPTERSGATASWQPEAAGEGGAVPPEPLPSPEAPAPPRMSEQLRDAAIRRLTSGTYSPGRNPRQEIATGLMVPKGGKVTTEGGMAPDDARALLEMREQAYQSSMLEQTSIARARAAMAAQQQAEAEAAIPRLVAQRSEREAQLAEMGRRHQEKMVELQGGLDAASRREVNPDRLWQNMNGFQGVVGLLGMAMGAWANSQSGGRVANVTYEMIQRRIAQDISAQEKAINQRIDRGQNALSLYLRQYDGDMGMAKAALGATMQSLVDAQAQRLAAASKNLDVQAQLADWTQKTRNQQIDWLRDFDAAARGKVTREVAQEFAVPKAGGYVGPSAGNLAKASELAERGEAGGTAGYEGQVAQAKAFGKAGGTAAGTVAGGGLGPGQESRLKAFSTAETKHAETQGDLDELTGLLGGSRKGDAIAWDRKKNIPGIGPLGGKVPGLLAGEDGRRVRQALSNFLNNYINTTNKGPASDSDVARLDKALRGYGTETEIQDAVANMQRKLNVSRRAVRAQAGQSVVNRYNQQRSETSAGYTEEMAQQNEDTEGLKLEGGDEE